MHNLWNINVKGVFKTVGFYTNYKNPNSRGAQSGYLNTVYESFIPILPYYKITKTYLLKTFLHTIHNPYCIKNKLNKLIIVMNYQKRTPQPQIFSTMKLLILKGQ